MPQLTWLITGCTSGFGEELVKSILKRGDKAIATGRGSLKRLNHVQELGAATLELDVCAPQTTLNSKVQDALAIYGGIDVLVNNAGYIEAGLLEDVRFEIPLLESISYHQITEKYVGLATSACSRTWIQISLER